MADQNFKVKHGLQVGVGATVLVAESNGNNGTLVVSGISRFENTVNIGTGITFYPLSGIVSAKEFYGDGENLTNLLSQKIDGINVRNSLGQKIGVSNVASGSTFAFIHFTDDFVIPSISPSTIFETAASGIGTVGINTDTITGISTSGIVEGQVLKEINGVISAGTTVISIGESQVGLGTTTNNSGITTTTFTFGTIGIGASTVAVSIGTVTNAQFAGTATNIAAGSTGDIPYQSDAGNTTYVSHEGRSNGKVLMWNDLAKAPQWKPLSDASDAVGLTVKDEGNLLTGLPENQATELNFVGKNIGVTTGGAGIATITVPENIRADSIGIGTDSPYQVFQVNSTNTFDIVVSAAGTVAIGTDTITGINTANIESGYFVQSTTNGILSAGTTVVSVGENEVELGSVTLLGASDETFKFGPFNDAKVAVITSDGKIGIGTSTPSSGLDVKTHTTLNSITIGTLNSNIIPADDNTLNIGSSTKRLSNIYASTVTANITGVANSIGIETSGTTDVDRYIILSDISVDGNTTAKVDSNLTYNSGTSTFDVTGHSELDTLNVGSASTFADDVTFSGNTHDVKWQKANDTLNFSNGSKAGFGDDNDFEIYVDGTNAYIKHDGDPGDLIIENDSSESHIIIKVSNDDENAAVFKQDGEVELYYDGAKKFETTSSGIAITNPGNNTVTISAGTGVENIVIDPRPTGVGAFFAQVSIAASVGISTDRIELISAHSGNIQAGQIVQCTTPNIIGSGVTVLNPDVIGGGDRTVVGIATTTLNENSSAGTIENPLTFQFGKISDGNVYIKGDLYVEGTEFIVSSETITLADFVVGIASTATTDVLADGAGIKVGPDNTFLYDYDNGTSPSFKSSENLNVASNKVYQIDGTEVLSSSTLGSNVTNSSLTNVGTLTNLDVGGHTETDTLNVSGITTLGVTNVSGITTFKDNVILDSTNAIQIPVGTTEERGFRVLETKTGDISGVGTDRITGIDTTGIEVDQYILGPSGVLRSNTQVESIGIGSIGIGTTALASSSGGTFRFGSIGLSTGQIRFNTNDQTFEGYGPGGEWEALGSVKDVDRDTYITAQKDLAVDDDTLRFYTNSVEQVSIDSTGKVGIGSTQPTAKLDVDGTLNVSGISTLADIILTGSANSITFDPSTNNSKTFFIRGEGNGNATIENDDEMYVSSTHLYIQKPGGTTTMAEFIEDGAVKLNHNNITKLQTHDYGIDVTGRVETDTLNVSGIVTARSFVGSGEGLTNLDAYAAYTSDRSTLATIADKISGVTTYVEEQGFNYLSGNESFHNNSSLYGVKVEASDDGKVMFVSSTPYNTGDQAGCGVQIFERTTSNFDYIGFVTSLSHHTLGVGQTLGDLGDWFGPILASNADGSIFAVGSPNLSIGNFSGDEQFGFWDNDNNPTHHGYVSIFQKTGNKIEPLGILTAPAADIDSSLDSGGYLENPSAFGHALAFNADGTKLYVSAPGIETNTYGGLRQYQNNNIYPQRGLVYAYNKNGSSYQQVGVITSQRFGTAWNQSNSTRPFFGHRIACSGDGDTIYISAPQSDYDISGERAGLVEVVSRTGNNFTQVGVLTHANNDPNIVNIWSANEAQFGTTLDCSSDGNIVVIGAKTGAITSPYEVGGSGAIVIYEKTNSGFVKISEEIFDLDDANLPPTNRGIATHDLKVNSDASIIAVSFSTVDSTSTNNPTGYFAAYSRDGGNLSRQGFFSPTIPQSNSILSQLFGSSLAIDSTGNNIFVGAPWHHLGSTSNSLADKGSAYVFNVSRQIALHSNQVTGYIGIGTDNPSTPLHVIGDVTATNFNSTSDLKLKTNVHPVENPVGIVTQLQGVTFNWIENNKPSMGVIADELEKVLPELVTDTDPKTVNYNGLIGLLIETVKDQQNQIDELKSRLD